jgi:uncharacterized membrane protein
VSLYQWLLFFHVTGAFFLIGGIVIAGILNLAAIVQDRPPSQVATLYGLIRFAVPLIGIGLVLTLAIGLWLVHNVGYSYGQTWIVLAIVLWVFASALGNVDGKYQRRTGELAQRLAAEGDAPSLELRARLRNPRALLISYGSGLMAFAVLGLMIWKPGA